MRTVVFVMALATAMSFSMTIGAESATVRIGILADEESEFWTQLRDTLTAEAGEMGVAVDFQTPSPATAERQNELAEEMVANGAQALAICPIDPEEQTAAIDALADKTPVITVLRDAPESKRIVFLGRDDEEVGRALAQATLGNTLVGLKVMLFCKDVKDADAQRLAGFTEIIEGTMALVDKVIPDSGDRMLAHANMDEVLRTRPEISALIGLHEYHGPAMVRAVKEHNREGWVRIITLGATPEMEAAFKAGVVHAIVTDDPIGYGQLLLTTLAALAQHDDNLILPEDKIIVAPMKVLETEKVMTQEDIMNELLLQVPWISETAPGMP